MHELIETAFGDLMSSEEIEIFQEDGETHIAADDWTLVLEGDPLSGALIALDDESGLPAQVLPAVIDEPALAAMRDLDAQVDGALSSLLARSPDSFAVELARLIKNQVSPTTD